MSTLRRIGICVLAGVAMLSAKTALAQVNDAPDAMIAKIPVNYTEAKVGNFVLPDVLKMFDGRPVTTCGDVERRAAAGVAEILSERNFRPESAIDGATQVTWEVVSVDLKALDGKAVMKTLAAHMGGKDGPVFTVTLYTPAEATKPVPMLLAINS